jgi:hypothetical protein
MKYKLINQSTNESHLCNKITLDGFEYFLNNKLGFKTNDFYFDYHGNIRQWTIEFQVENKLPNSIADTHPKVIATNNPNIDLPQVISEIEDLANNHSVDDNVWSKESFIQGYNKSQETHPYSEQDLEDFYIWKDKNRWFNFENGKWNYTFEHGTSIGKETYEKHYRKTTKELIQMWREQQPNIINIK